MRRVEKFQTQDGRLFDTFKEAERHADRCYGDALKAIAVDLCDAERRSWAARMEFIDNNLDRFAQLAELKADFLLTNPEEED